MSSYLAVPFEEKDQAQQAIGARWDSTARLRWTAPANRARAGRWLP